MQKKTIIIIGGISALALYLATQGNLFSGGATGSGPQPISAGGDGGNNTLTNPSQTQIPNASIPSTIVPAAYTPTPSFNTFGLSTPSGEYQSQLNPNGTATVSAVDQRFNNGTPVSITTTPSFATGLNLNSQSESSASGTPISYAAAYTYTNQESVLPSILKNSYNANESTNAGPVHASTMNYSPYIPPKK